MIDYSRFISKVASNIKASEIRELLAIIRGRKDVISFAGGIPDPALFPRKELAKIAGIVIEKYGDDALQYSETKGIIEVRETLSDFLARKREIHADAEDIIITSGSQSALDIVSRALIDPGDIVITESPSYLAALGAFKMNGAKLIGVKIDENGMRTELLEEKLKQLGDDVKKVKFIYVIPVGQNPAGTTMNKERKKHLLEIASKYDLLILEDDPYSYIIYEEGAETASLKSLDKEGRVMYMSTVSKILAPGLRIGWIVAEKELIRRFEIVKQYVDLHSPTLNQFIVAEAIKTGLIDDVVQKAIPYYKAKRNTMLEAIKENFPDYVWYSKPIGGLFVFAYVYKNGFNAGVLLEKAVKQYKVAYVPGGSFHPEGDGVNSMRLNFSYPTHEQIREGIARLAKLIRES
ncbi:PLP-dependent aminotransferase family protein [Desulfurococcus amylolyticus]|uniref:aminotransferase-like domain-containing protein n=1 Tax=Desulfurococcus amylolyticus TaxID=94694 RepID=UPI0005B1F105|nr:PLP-dependent aminotransferase family protein [Desulfurococcus amylolyticus]